MPGVVMRYVGALEISMVSFIVTMITAIRTTKAKYFLIDLPDIL